MLSIGKLGVGQQQYYLDAVAKGAEDYYTNSGEAPGAWVGAAAAELGLGGTVHDVDLHAVLSGLHPQTLVGLVRANQKVPGFDLTFSAPKSVSLLWALTPDRDVARVVMAAHDTAVRAAVGWLERQATFVRRGRNGVHQLDGSGLVAAAFRHRLSRAGDPQLHTHVVAANMTRGADGKWSALDARHLYWQARTAGALYRSELRRQLSQELGVAWTTADDRGFHEIEGITAAQRREFSRRRQDIEQVLAERGIGGAEAARVATLHSRQAKDYTVNADNLRSDWQQRATSVGLTDDKLRSLTTRDNAASPVASPVNADELGRELTEHDSTFTRSDVLQALAARHTAGATIDALNREADAFLREALVVRLAADARGPRYSTREQLDLEKHVLELAEAGKHRRVAVVDKATADDATRRRSLSREQQRMVDHLVTSGNAVDVVVGVAGSGKTTALAAAHDAWRSNNIPVVGAALAARAAAELQAGSGIPSTTLASLLIALEGPINRLPAGGVLVIDEAGMVGTRDIARVLDLAHRDAAKVVLVGDHRQLPEIEAGGAFAALAQRLDAVALKENRRQRSRHHRATLRHLRHGNAATALNQLRERGDLVTTETRSELLDRMIEDWKHARALGGDVLMLAARRSVVAELNERARRYRREAGEIGPDAVVVDGRAFAVGDRVIAHRNLRSSGLMNGSQGTVNASVDGTVSVALDDGRTVVVPRRYLDAGHLTHGYAATIHKAQGSTVDHALVLADLVLAREGAYVGLSRGKQTNRLYATVVDVADDTALEVAHTRNTWNLLTRLSRSAAKHLASELSARREQAPRGVRV